MKNFNDVAKPTFKQDNLVVKLAALCSQDHLASYNVLFTKSEWILKQTVRRQGA